MMDNIFSFSILPFIILIPLIGALCIARISDQMSIRLVSIWSAAFVFALTTVLLLLLKDDFEATYSYYYFSLSLNGLSMYFAEVMAFLTLLSTLIGRHEISDDIQKFYIPVMVLESSTLMLFFISNILLFSCLLEIIACISYFLARIFSSKSEYLAKQFILLFFGVIFTIFGTAYIVSITGAMEIHILADYTFSFAHEQVFFVIFFMGLYCICGLFPAHMWIPDTYADAPAAVSVLLCGLVSLIGGFGIMTILVPIAKNVYLHWHSQISHVVFGSVVYFLWAAAIQKNLERVLAYVFCANVAVSIIGIFSGRTEGVAGAAYHMMANSLVMALLFIVARAMTKNQGKEVSAMVVILPLLVLLATPLLPFFNGEFFIIYGLMHKNYFFGVLVCVVVVLGMFSAVKALANCCPGVGEIKLRTDNPICLISLMLLLVLMGLFPNGVVRSVGGVCGKFPLAKIAENYGRSVHDW
ncbi:MAG: hypothetical protein LBT70_03190 [Holosporaceae bacterium]|nr:hypothetical protein [Holosporaceae bacterium]